MRDWLVAGAVIESEDGLLLVRNLRRNGAFDWTPPGGVIEIDDDEDIRDGLAREVFEETGLTITGWGDQLYDVQATAPDLGWIMRAQVFHVTAVSGSIVVGNDPDGIVTAAEYVPIHRCATQLADTHRWVSEPLNEWLDHRFAVPRSYHYELVDAAEGRGRIVRV